MNKKLFALFLLASPVLTLGASSREVYVELRGPTLVGYFPAVTQDELDDKESGAAEGIAHLQFALQDVSQCLKKSGITAEIRSVLGSSFTVSDKGRTKRIELPTSGAETVGMYLLEPGKEPRAVPAQLGPSSLIALAPEAAADFYQAAACKPME